MSAALTNQAALSGAVALVTGASSGIGRATAIELARRGARVAVHYFSKPDGAQGTMEAIQDLGGRAVVLHADIRDREQVTRLVREAEAALGPIDILVNNAGDLIRRVPLLEMTEAQWHEVMDLNMTSVLICTQAAVAGMIARKRGVIVNMSSLAAHNGGGPGAGAYAAAKAAVLAFSKALAKEVAPYGIRVNCVAPGLIGDTAFHARFTPKEAFEATTRTIPLQRPGTPDDVAQVIAFLCTNESAYLTGETIEINGGLFMR